MIFTKAVLRIAGLLSLATTAGHAAELLKTVKVVKEEKTTHILAVPSGLSVYTFDNDAQGVPACYARCAEVWPPVLLTPAEEKALQAPLGAVKRTTGTTQLTLNGEPLYLYFADRVETNVLGDGIGGVWHLVAGETPADEVIVDGGVAK